MPYHSDIGEKSALYVQTLLPVTIYPWHLQRVYNKPKKMSLHCCLNFLWLHLKTTVFLTHFLYCQIPNKTAGSKNTDTFLSASLKQHVFLYDGPGISQASYPVRRQVLCISEICYVLELQMSSINYYEIYILGKCLSGLSILETDCFHTQTS